MTTTIALSARDIMRAAYENRYTWDANFPGYTAEVTFGQGTETHTAQVRIDADYKFEVSGIEDEDAKKAINSQVWEIAVHRVTRPFEETHAKNTFELGETDETGAVELLVAGKSTGDKYKVRDSVVTLVHRHIHGVVVTINTLDTYDTGAGYLSSEYDSIYSDPKTGEVKGAQSTFSDSYAKIGDYHILTQRVIKSADPNQPDMTFAFANIQLLDAA